MTSNYNIGDQVTISKTSYTLPPYLWSKIGKNGRVVDVKKHTDGTPLYLVDYSVVPQRRPAHKRFADEQKTGSQTLTAVFMRHEWLTFAPGQTPEEKRAKAERWSKLSHDEKMKATNSKEFFREQFLHMTTFVKRDIQLPFGNVGETRERCLVDLAY